MSSRPFHSYEVRNLIDNPDGRDGIGTLGTVFTNFQTLPSISVVQDETLPLHLNSTAKRKSAFEIQLTPSTTTISTVSMLVIPETFVLPAAANEPMFTRMIAKKVDGESIVVGTCNVAAGRTNGTVINNRETVRMLIGDDWTNLEGFEVAPLDTQFALMAVGFIMPPGTETATVRCIFQFDPLVKDGDVPIYVDDDELHHTEVPKFGFNIPLMVDPGAPITPSQMLTRAAQCGADTVRSGINVIEDLSYDVAEPLPDFSTGFHKDLMDEVRDHGLKFVAILPWPLIIGDSVYDWANASPSDYQYMVDWTAAFAEEHRDVLAAIEWHNEPNLDLFWNFSYHFGDAEWSPIDPVKYMDVQKLLYPACKAVAPEVPFIGGCLAGAPSTVPGIGGHMAMTEFYEVMLDEGAEDYMDAISFHPYPVGARSGRSTDGTNPLAPSSGFHDTINSMREVHINRNIDIPIWLTETGYETTTMDRRNALIQGKTVGLLRGIGSRMPDIDYVNIHVLTDDSGWAIYEATSDRWREGAVAVGA